MAHEPRKSMHLLLIKIDPDGKHGHHDGSTAMNKPARWVDRLYRDPQDLFDVLFQVPGGTGPLGPTPGTKHKRMIGLGPTVCHVEVEVGGQRTTQRD
jgi:hypothetical protein